MTKKTLSALVIAMAVTSTGISQEISKTDSSAEKISKNELGFNIAPIAVALMGGEAYRPTFSLSYKRIIKEKNALRFSLNYQFPMMNWNYGDDYYIVSQTDNTQLRRYFERDNGNKIQTNIGYERRFGKRKIKYFFGADLTLGFTNESYRIYDENFVLEKYPYQGLYYSPQSGGIDTLYQFISDPDSFAVDIYSETTKYISVGTSPFFGFYYPLSKRFSLSFRTGFDLYFSLGKKDEKNYTNNETTKTRVSTFDFNMNGLINDLSIVYRF